MTAIAPDRCRLCCCMCGISPGQTASGLHHAVAALISLQATWHYVNQHVVIDTHLREVQGLYQWPECQLCYIRREEINL
jgi:hypothetical protein